MLSATTHRVASTSVDNYASPLALGSATTVLHAPRIDAATPVAEAARLLLRSEADALAVVGRGMRLVGLFTLRDAARALAAMGELERVALGGL